MNKHKKRWLLVLVFLLCSVASLSLGAFDLTIEGLLSGNDVMWQIVLQSRIPRLIAVILTGVSLATAGLIMQRIAQNKFVSPSTAVTMDAARLGIIVSFFFNLTMIQRSFFALLFALLATTVFMRFITKLQFKNAIFIPLVGMMLGMIVEGITTFIAMKHDLMQVLSGYLSGNFTFIIKGNYELLYIGIPLIILAFIFIKRFNILAMGEAFATNVGVKYHQTQSLGIVIVSMLSALVMTTVGTVPFVGLIVPNMITMVNGESYPYMLLDIALLGAILLLSSDILARLMIYPYEVPLNLILGCVGTVFFLVMIVRRPHEN